MDRDGRWIDQSSIRIETHLERGMIWCVRTDWLQDDSHDAPRMGGDGGNGDGCDMMTMTMLHFQGRRSPVGVGLV